MYWIIGDDGKEYGPASTDEIRQWIALGRCGGRMRARSETSPDWKPVAQFPEFSQSLAAFAALGALALPPEGPPRTSGLAIASLACGIGSLVICFAAPIGVVLGFLARSEIRKSQGRLSGAGMALAGIITSFVMMLTPIIAICVVLAAGRAGGTFNSAHQRAQSIQCEVRLKQLTLAVRMYAEERSGRLPPAVTWCDAIAKRVGSTNTFHCPAQAGDDCSYAFNQKLDGKTLNEVSPQTVLLFESDAGWNGTGGEDSLANRKHVAARRNRTGYAAGDTVYHVTFVDGTFAAIPASGLAALRWEP